MARKHHKPEEIVAKLRQVEVPVEQGKPVAEAVRAIGVTEATYYRWRAEYGGLKLDQLRRLKVLEQENRRLRRAVVDLTLEKLGLKEADSGNPLSGVIQIRVTRETWSPLVGAAVARWGGRPPTASMCQSAGR